MIGAQKFKMGHVTLTMRICGLFVMPKPVFDMAYLVTTVEDYSFSCCRDMKEEPKYKNRGDLGWFGVTSNINIWYRAHTTSCSSLIETYASILYRFPDIASHLSKVASFTYTTEYLAPPLEAWPGHVDTATMHKKSMPRREWPTGILLWSET